ncbi:carboxylesterase family protein [Rhizobium leguminosarum]|uniref:carboxylesterase family protein n=1 Tax=Rhizobium leguminosarum TaxID=384 RepID=UPI0039658B75
METPMTMGRPGRRAFLSTVALVIAAPIVLRGTMACSAEPVTAKIKNGILRGVRAKGALSFKGIPYAAGTAGANRFKAPQPVADWHGERDATKYGSLSPQINTGMSGLCSAGITRTSRSGRTAASSMCSRRILTPTPTGP